MKHLKFTFLLFVLFIPMIAYTSYRAQGQAEPARPTHHFAQSEVLLARGTNGMTTWKFNHSTNTWTELVSSSPAFSDANGWDSADNYSTIQTGDIDGDGLAELLARGANGMTTWKFDYNSNTWSELAVATRPFKDSEGWDSVDNYSTIQTADIDGDGVGELLARGTNGMTSWKFNGITWVELISSSPAFSDTNGWDSEDNYSTIQTADIDGDGADELLARGANGMTSWKFNGTGWDELVSSSPPFSDAQGWDSVDNYSTIQTGDIDGDGADELLARGTNGMTSWKYSGGVWTELISSSPAFSDANGWDSEDNYRTIQTADIDGDGADELLARGTNGMTSWKFNGTGWDELISSSPPFNDSEGWDSADNYLTIQTGDIDGDGAAELLARGTNGITSWKYSSGSWTELVSSSPPFSDGEGWDGADNYSTIQTANLGPRIYRIYLPFIVR